MNHKPDPSDFTHNGVLQQPHYDNAVKAWEKIEQMEQVEKLKLSPTQKKIVEEIRQNGKILLNKVKWPTTQSLIKSGICDYNGSFDALILTDKYKQ